ncbi:fungal-specific transcription factor domain-containing protein [Ilyonectria robusta]|uniref:fungal-specific transcription factor domain-containing protein n=1 Tax=Ilyonectria robusta TaxID=1079257 RepID=UPI001E8D7B18|nr:fungal-specific transcription factor domain-containing protein [Ilyonectria robusta]KAH8733612.1 fungal-specific transcription factor domain-containing protein [Ilyonectria robusta]
MKTPLRSKQGCWTCRLRKKKCDERQPVCAVCESLLITCYGYGPKPEWMDDGEEEKAMISSIKHIVKHTSRRRGRRDTPQTQIQRVDNDQSVQNLAPTPVSKVQGASSPNLKSSVDSQAAARDEHSQMRSIGSSINSIPESSAIPASEAVLLMHFLDNVFPLQFPMYQSGIAEGGRGCFLSLILRKKPLLHAVLCLSVYHRETVLAASSAPHGEVNWDRLEEHHAICLAELQKAIGNMDRSVSESCTKDGLGIAASMMQLIFFELFVGKTNMWQMHLRAATDLLDEGYSGQSALLIKFLTAPEANGTSDAEPLEYDPPSPEQEVMMKLFVGVVIWLDIIASVTTGTTPRLLSLHRFVLSPGSQIQLENIMGCQNWPMLQIARIAALHEYKYQALRDGCFETAKFESTADDIKKILRRGLSEGFLRYLTVSDSDPDPVHSADIPLPLLITHLFALTACIYLHVVVSGFQIDGEDLKSTLAEAMMVIREKIPQNMWHVIVWPLYVTGTVASEEEKELFRSIFRSPPLLNPSLEHRRRILPLLEETWCMRETTARWWDWESSVRPLNNSLLLL